LIFIDLIKGIKNSVKLDKKEEELIGGNKNHSDGQIKSKNFKANILYNPELLSYNKSEIEELDIVTQVNSNKKDEDYDISKLTNIEDIKDYYEYTENCLNLISKLQMPSDEEVKQLQIELPEKLLKKKLAIFDLDETLVHCELKNPTKAEKIITIKLPNGNKARVSKLFLYQ